MQKTIYLLSALFLLLSILPEAANAQRRKKGKKKEVNYLSRTASPQEIIETENKLEKLYRMFTGHFSNKEQADTTSLAIYAEQEVVMVPIWNKRVGEYWVYWAWIIANKPEMTLGEGVFKFSRINRDSFLIENYSLPSELRGQTSLEWAKREPLGQYSPKNLQKLECSNYATEKEPNVFDVEADRCCKEYDLSNFGELAGMALHLRISAEDMHDFSEYCDKNDELLFKYDRPIGAYYKRLPKENPKYQGL